MFDPFLSPKSGLWRPRLVAVERGGGGESCVEDPVTRLPEPAAVELDYKITGEVFRAILTVAGSSGGPALVGGG